MENSIWNILRFVRSGPQSGLVAVCDLGLYLQVIQFLPPLLHSPAASSAPPSGFQPRLRWSCLPVSWREEAAVHHSWSYLLIAHCWIVVGWFLGLISRIWQFWVLVFWFSILPLCTFAFGLISFLVWSPACLLTTFLLAHSDTVASDCVFAVCVLVRKEWLPYLCVDYCSFG